MAQDKEQKPIFYYGTGRRKTSVARVRVYKNKGNTLVNQQPLDKFFCVDEWIVEATRPLEVTGLKDQIHVKASTHGGGIHGQAGAFSHGLARALLEMDPSLRPVLKNSGLLKRDPRMSESKKYGLHRARKGQQYTKR